MGTSQGTQTLRMRYADVAGWGSGECWIGKWMGSGRWGMQLAYSGDDFTVERKLGVEVREMEEDV